MAKELARIGPDQPEFPDGLMHRNVIWTESNTSDNYADEIRLLSVGKAVPETAGEKESYGQLWAMDQAKCDEGSSEALFQRTLMMALIARHILIYDKGAKRNCLDFSVEQTWICSPMPTRAYWMGVKFLTQPKPDLAISFRRLELIPDNLWNKIPVATRRLACYENISGVGGTRIFPFLTIEAKKALTSTGDIVGKCQSLNNASQSLHNMFEFFRDAGPSHEKLFFAKVRFFSVVASTEGLTIRIHQATQEPADGSDLGLIMPNTPDYPLKFEHREFARIPKDSFGRERVLEILGKILLGYGAGVLGILLQNASKDLVARLDKNVEEIKKRCDVDFYRYGQIIKAPRSRIHTPALSQNSLVSNRKMEPPVRARSDTNLSIDMLRSGTTTPTQTQPNFPAQPSQGKVKRPRGQSEDNPRNIRRRKQ